MTKALTNNKVKLEIPALYIFPSSFFISFSVKKNIKPAFLLFLSICYKHHIEHRLMCKNRKFSSLFGIIQ